MTIGIGITTTPNREAIFKETLKCIKKYTKVANLYIHNDTNYNGVAYAKNMCMYHLRRCSYVFLFDDDCYPIDENWLDYVIDCFDYTGENHFLFLNDKLHQPLERYNHIGITEYKECGGVFMAYTKQVINTIGYMDSEYSGWGFEHAGWSNRVYKAGLNSAAYLMPEKLPTMLRALDYTGKVTSSISDVAKQKGFQNNIKVFQREMNEQPTYKRFKP
jgi:hypothetical protein